MKRLLTLFAFFFYVVSASAQVYSAIPEPAAARDAFERWRVSSPQTLYDAQFTYGLQPLLFDTITVGSNITIAHDATNRLAKMQFASSPSGSTVAMQSFEFIRYQPGKSQQIFVTFNLWGGQSNVVKFAGYSDGENGIEFLMNGTTPTFRILSSTDKGTQTVAQSNWNIDKLDGTGVSGDSLDLTKLQILVIDFQALYVGRVRVGFDIDGQVKYAHEFLHANDGGQYPYFATANLPIRVGMTSSATVTDSLYFICSTVISEGGQEDTGGYPFSYYRTLTAASGVDSAIINIQPKTTFNSIENHSKLKLESIDIAVTGANPILWKLCVGQALTGTTTADINTTYSGAQAVIGTPSGSPSIVLEQGILPASSQTRSSISKESTIRLPITLGHDGSQRDLGRITLLVQGIGGTSAVHATLNWVEIR